ncbi:glutathione transferase GST 23-like [Phalaenopsis equestris]|uniref:glutathione transferase GST 23-like n=1 Tax=Phalaenopsis equestris TaxID=78828 RepID=UPI0009E4F6CC|nr:glutathione transferase GST 23-like [Phalaenopsis equestris]
MLGFLKGRERERKGFARMRTSPGEVVLLRGMWASPAVHRVAWALRLKGIEYEYVEEDLEEKSKSLLELNPITKKVPVLVHEGKPVVESLVILEYIDEVWTYGAPLLPKNAYERSRARFLATFLEDKGREAARKLFFAGEGERKDCLEAFEDILEVLEKELIAKGEFFGGQSIGYLDIVVGWIPFWLGVIVEKVLDFQVIDAAKFPKFATWSKNFLPHFPGDMLESVITLPPEDMAIEYFTRFRNLHLVSAK